MRRAVTIGILCLTTPVASAVTLLAQKPRADSNWRVTRAIIPACEA